MTDYGHDLLFGTFLTPDAGRPTDVVGLARVADEAGLDLVTIQDHPYQAKFLDAWTLLSTMAASTVNVRLALNVANLPLRPPAVLARSHASLDVLSGGRVELGLGAGAFWDAIEGNGGPRRTPGEAVAALDEAIDVIRGLWATDAGSVRHDGEHYRLRGAHAGPAPAHEMAMWVGAVGPRMQRLIGRKADGWLPSMMYLGPEKLADANARIDDAAQEAGRSPSDVRRLYNVAGKFTAGRGRGLLEGPPEVWAEQLADLALTRGTSAFILATDDADTIRRFAAEVAPAVRERVEAERLTGGVAAAEVSADSTGAAGSTGGISTGSTREVPVSDVWDESTRPTGPGAPEGHTYTDHDVATGQHLVDVHDHLRAELAQVEDIVEQVARGVLGAGQARSHIATMTLRQNNWTLATYCETYCRLVTTHHTIEDQSMFPHLRTADPGLSPVIDRLEAEHAAIHDVLEGVDRALVAMVGSPDAAEGIAGLQAAMDRMRDALLSHLAYEEQELVEPLARFGLG